MAPMKTPKRPKSQKELDKELDKDIANVTNPFQALLVILSHKALLIPTIIIVVIVMAFMTIRVTYKDGSWIWEKKEIKMHQAIERAEKLKKALEN